MEYNYLNEKGEFYYKKPRQEDEDLTSSAIESKLVRQDPVSEEGQVTYLPRGAIVRELLYKYLYGLHCEEEAFFLRTPILCDYENHAVKNHAELSGEGIYHTNSSGSDLILQHGTIFTQMQMLSENPIAAANLPIKMFEIADCHRIEKESRLDLLSRPRQFSMIDMHIICRDMQDCKAEATRINRKIMDVNKDMGLDLDAAFTVDEGFMESDFEWIKQRVKDVGRDVKIERAKPEKKRPINAEYFSSGIEVAAFQIDKGNADKFNLVMDDGNVPVIMHVSFAGSIERWLFALMKNPFPMWLAPEQVRIISCSRDTVEMAENLRSHNIRVTVDDRNIAEDEKIALARKAHVPFLLRETREGFYLGEENINDLEQFLTGKLKDESKPALKATYPVRLSRWPEQFRV